MLCQYNSDQNVNGLISYYQWETGLRLIRSPNYHGEGGGGRKSLETHLGWHVGLSVRALRDQTPTGGAGTFHHQWQKEGKGEHLKVWAVQGVA